MRIALINENSQASKNEVIYQALCRAAAPHGYEVVNYGMFDDQDEPLTYVQNGLLAALLLNSGAADYVVTGCGTGQGAMLACNAFPGVQCGHIEDPLDAYTFAQINDGNAVAIPFAKGFGWGGDLNLEYIFEKLFSEEGGQGYPRERAVPERQNREILTSVKNLTNRDLKEVLPQLDPALLGGVLCRPSFQTLFFRDCPDEEWKQKIRDLSAARSQAA